MTTRHDGTIIYTPFPDYEVEDPSGSGANTTRTTYRIAGQIVAVQTKVGTQNGVFYYTYGDHLGNVVLLSYLGGTPIGTSLARYDPFGNYRTPPATTTNPAITSHGFTGHKHNNTGGYPTQNVGLIYMNARYYLPEVGRFISPDSIVPDPGNPQSYNRYSYGYNNPVKYVDPSGHCVLLPPVDTAVCAIVAGSTVSAGTIAAGAAATTALTVVFTDAISSDFNPLADIANLIGDIAEGAGNLGREIMKNAAGPSASGNPNDLDPQDPNKRSEPEALKAGKSAHQRLGREYIESVPEEQRHLVDLERTFIDSEGKIFRPDIVNHATGEIIEFKPASWATNRSLYDVAERQAASYADRLNSLYGDSRALDGLSRYTYRIEFYP